MQLGLSYTKSSNFSCKEDKQEGIIKTETPFLTICCRKSRFQRNLSMASLGECVTFCIETACWQSWPDCSLMCRATDRSAENEAGLSFALRDFNCDLYCNTQCLVLLKGQCPIWSALPRAFPAIMENRQFFLCLFCF